MRDEIPDILSDADRLVPAVSLERLSDSEPDAGRLLVDAQKFRAHAHTRAHWNRRWKAHGLVPIVQKMPEAGHLVELVAEARAEAECQQAVSDRRPELSSAPGLITWIQ